MDEETKKKIREAARCLGHGHRKYVFEVTGLLVKWIRIYGPESGSRFFDEYEKSPEKVINELKRFDVTFPPNDDSAKN